MLVFSHMKDNLVKEKVCCFWQFCQRKNFILLGGGGEYYTVDNFVEYIILWRKKTFTVDFVYRKTILRKNFIFANTKFFFFFNRTLSTGVRRVPNSTKVPKEEFKLPFSYLLCVNQRGFLISSSLVKYYIFYDFRQSLCRFN